MSSGRIVRALLPWVLFCVVVGLASATGRSQSWAVAFGGVVGAVACVIFAVRASVPWRRVTILDLTQFLVLVGAASFGHTGAARGPAATTLVISIVMLASTAFVPFTEQYAREAVPRSYWDSPVFRSTQVRASVVWGTSLIVVSVLQLIGLGVASGPVGLLVSVGIPVGIIWIAATRSEMPKAPV